MNIHVNVWCVMLVRSSMSVLLSLHCLQEDINVTSEAGRQHIFGQSLHDKRELIRGWILRDHRPVGVRKKKKTKKPYNSVVPYTNLYTVHVLCM